MAWSDVPFLLHFFVQGEMDVMMLAKLLQIFPSINNRVVEPSRDQLLMYKAHVQARADQLQGVVCDWRQQTMDEYQKAGNHTKFHFISAIHSLYYAEDIEQSLLHLYDLLELGGMLLVIARSGNGIITTFISPYP